MVARIFLDGLNHLWLGAKEKTLDNVELKRLTGEVWYPISLINLARISYSLYAKTTFCNEVTPLDQLDKNLKERLQCCFHQRLWLVFLRVILIDSY